MSQPTTFTETGQPTDVAIINPPATEPLVEPPVDAPLDKPVEPPPAVLLVGAPVAGPLVDTLTEPLVKPQPAGPPPATPWICARGARRGCNLGMRAHFQKFRLGRVPVWLRKRILEKFGRAASDVPLGLRFDWLCRWLDCHSWIDHVGSAVFEGHRVFVSQPYGDAVDFDPREVDIFCRVLDLEYRIDERSDWWPGETFSILIFAPTSSNAEAGQ